MKNSIAIVGMACHYADARSPQELWETALVKRRAFRRIPSGRLSLDDYFSKNKTTPDSIYVEEAAVIEGYEFDRIKFRVSGSTFRSADLVHWLALDMVDKALADAKFSEGKELPKEVTGVLLGNTLTGEFSRANSLRLRWHYVRRVVEEQLVQQGMQPAERETFLTALEMKYKQPFAPIGEESLAGNLSNTIAGRICNYYDLKGGGYTVDGACSSSLLAVATACNALVTGDLDVAIAGGVDLSLDPFELVGFAKTGALTDGEMRVYDTHSAGFLPGEGCGIVVLMRYEDAIAQSRPIYSLIQGWGISSDGQGGITRPEVEGQLLAIQRAYRRAGFGIDTVGYFEGHGTGTAVGDTTELQALSRARRETQAKALAVIGSIKANIGHTKAAAGIAGLIKATMALDSQIIPPTTGCEDPHSELTVENPALQVLSQGQLWSHSTPLRAGVSAMGFGGINTHVVLEGVSSQRRQSLEPIEAELLTSFQDTELFLLSASTVKELQQQIAHLLTLTPKLSRAEIGDLSVELARTLQDDLSIRAAIIACQPQELDTRLKRLKGLLSEGVTTVLNVSEGIFLGTGKNTPRIGFLFPGQASPVYLNGGIWEQRFPQIKALYQQAELPISLDRKATDIAQPALVTSAIAGFQILDHFGITAEVAVGHSLGELSALCWSGVIDAQALIELAKVRGKAMAELGSPTGTMASLLADAETVQAFIKTENVVIAGINSPSQTVISGEKDAVEKVVQTAKKQGIKAILLPVSHAFHSPLVAAATPPLADYLQSIELYPLQRKVISTVTGVALDKDNIKSRLCEQITKPVRFLEALSTASRGLDLLIEVGSGQVLSRLIKDFVSVPIVPLDATGSSLSGLFKAVGAAFVLGTGLKHQNLVQGRFTRPFSLKWQPKFLVNPCELAPVNSTASVPSEKPIETPVIKKLTHPVLPETTSVLDYLRQQVAQRAELPPEAVQDSDRLLSDLHLNSITVGQLVIEAAQYLHLPSPASPTDYANATIAEIAQALEDQQQTHGITQTQEKQPLGVNSWVRTFTLEWEASPLPSIAVTSSQTHSPGNWELITSADEPLKQALQKAFKDYPGKGVIICLPVQPDERSLDLLLLGAKTVLESQSDHFILVQQGGWGAGFARTLHLESPQINTCVIHVPPHSLQAVDWIKAEIKALQGYSEASYDEQGKRRSRFLKLHSPSDQSPVCLSSEDVLLVTGGGKGIAAECALSIAKETGVRLALMGRSSPETDPELASNLQRFFAAGITVKYCSVDVTDAVAVTKAIADIEAELGVITALIHGAGINHPKLIQHLSKQDALQTIAPKVYGLEHLLKAIKSQNLRLLVSFGSIIARIGLPGEADYAIANEWLGYMIEQYQAQHPRCYCLNLEWSVWSGAGMGERLGRIDALQKQGITPITPDIGIAILNRLLTSLVSKPSILITGRFGEPPTLPLHAPELPFLRFLEKPRVYYPGVELVVDFELSPESDPYLNDHIVQNERIFPGVMGLEAMAQGVMALLETSQLPTFEQVQFNRPIVIPPDSPLTVRIAALVEDSGKVEVVLRSEQTAFAVDHFRATCTLENYSQPPTPIAQLFTEEPKLANAQVLYNDILFQRGRFQRLRQYQYLQATKCLAEIALDDKVSWFSRYLPGDLVLGDPGAKDAVIHALQGCIPHATLIPIGANKISIYHVQDSGHYWVSAQEKAHEKDTFIYDLQIISSNGTVLEEWEGLHLQTIQEITPQTSWETALLAPYIERRLQEFIPHLDLHIAIEENTTGEHDLQRNKSFTEAFGEVLPIYHRSDGKPEIHPSKSISIAHTQDLTLAVTSSIFLTCDLEPVHPRSSETWRDLLSEERYVLAELLVSEKEETLDVAATRIWTALECLKKAGKIYNTPLILKTISEDGWVLLQADKDLIATWVSMIKEGENLLSFAILLTTEFSEAK